MSEKEKLIELIKQNGVYNGSSMGIEYYVVEPEWLADTLIENGIGDISEWKAKANDWKQRFESRDKQYNEQTIAGVETVQLKNERIEKYKHRAEVAERALKNVIKQYKRCDELGACEECSERQGCVRALCDKYKQQAEREIEEERK